MISDKKFSAFLRLQQYVLDNQDNAHLTKGLFNSLLPFFLSMGIRYQFIALTLLNSNGLMNEYYFADEDSTNNPFPKNPINYQSFFQKGSPYEHEILTNKVFLIKKMPLLLSPEYLHAKIVKSCIISPVITNGKLIGILLLGSLDDLAQVDEEIEEIVLLISYFINLCYRLESTQTSLTKITQEVYEMNAKLHQLDKLKDDFVSIASHELRTPMTAIRSYAWMALYRSDVNLSERLKRYLHRTLISTERLINLVNDMLNISRIESGKIEILPSSFNIISLVDEVVAETSEKAREKNLHVIVNKTPMPAVFADSDKVHQVLLNLVGNSLKFTQIDGTITLSFNSDSKFVETSVADTGVGIAKDDLQRLFKKFGRLDNSYVAAATSGGTGLGLYISKSLIEMMGGSILGESEGEGKGSTFKFSLPAASQQVLNESAKYTKRVSGDVKMLEPVSI